MLFTLVWSRRTLRALLQLDRPAPARTDAELEAEARANYRWNFIVNMGDGATFWFGYSFISYTTILPLFVSKISTNPLLIALVAVLGQAGWYLPQLLTAGAIEKLARKKPVIVNLGLFAERVPVWLMPLAAMLSARNPLLGLTLFFVAYTWHVLGAGMVAPAWSEMIARCFPVERRGRFFGTTSFVGTGLGAIGALFSGWLLAVYAFPVNFALVFLVAAIAITISWFCIALTREPVQPVSDEILHHSGPSRRKVMRIVRGDHNFRWFLIAQFLGNVGRMGAGFLTVAAIQQWQISDSTVGQFTAAFLVGQTCGNLLAGLVADRQGHKVAQEVGMLAATIAFVLAWIALSVAWYFPAFFLLGANLGITIVSNVLMPLEFTQPAHRPTYSGISNTANGIGNTLAPLLGGLIALLGYNWLFALSALVGVGGLLVMHWLVAEPRAQAQLFQAGLGESTQ